MERIWATIRFADRSWRWSRTAVASRAASAGQAARLGVLVRVAQVLAEGAHRAREQAHGVDELGVGRDARTAAVSAARASTRVLRTA